MSEEEIDSLGRTYMGACKRMHEACTDLYESLHDKKGDPISDVSVVSSAVSKYRGWFMIEADLIREAVKQYREQFDGE